MYQFAFEAAEEILRHRIVVWLALPGHTLHKAQFFKLFPVCRCRILYTSIGMKHQPRCRALPLDRHAEYRQGQRCINAVGKRIAHHLNPLSGADHFPPDYMKQGVQPRGWLLLVQGDELTGQPLILLFSGADAPMKPSVVAAAGDFQKPA